MEICIGSEIKHKLFSDDLKLYTTIKQHVILYLCKLSLIAEYRSGAQTGSLLLITLNVTFFI